MTDEVRFPLIDYIRNARPSSSIDPDALFVTPFAPRTRIRTQSTIYNIVDHCVREAGIDVSGRRHGRTPCGIPWRRTCSAEKRPSTSYRRRSAIPT